MFLSLTKTGDDLVFGIDNDTLLAVYVGGCIITAFIMGYMRNAATDEVGSYTIIILAWPLIVCSLVGVTIEVVADNAVRWHRQRQRRR